MSRETDGDPEKTTPDPMSDFETLMWNLEADPWLNPSGALITILDRPVKPTHFRRSIQQAVFSVPRLRQRVVPPPTKLTTPGWETDPEFDLDYHLRALALPSSACSLSDLLSLGAWLYQQPYDRSRPLWQIITIEGLEGGKGAVFWKLHHTIGDATTMMKMQEFYMQLKRREKLPDKVNLTQLFAKEVAAQPSRSHNPVDELAETAASTFGTLAKRQTNLLRRALGEVMLWGADPVRAKEFGQDTIHKAASTIDQLRGAGTDSRTEPSHAETNGGGSPLWRARSRHRQIEALQLPLDTAKATAKTLGGSLNDFFVAGAVIGSLAYHTQRDQPIDWLNLSFVVSTRKSDDDRANAFTPMRLEAPGTEMSLTERFGDLKTRMRTKKDAAKTGAGMSSLAGAANLLPGSLVSAVARKQAAGVDFATSNFRGAPVQVFISGGKLVQNIPIGPVAGTAFNLTLMSYDNSLDLGITIDPVAVEDPAGLRLCIERAYEDLTQEATQMGNG